MVAIVIGCLVMSLLVEPSFSQYSTESTTQSSSSVTTSRSSHSTTASQSSTTLSAYDTVQSVWYQLMYCDYLGSSGKCDPYKSTLQLTLDHRFYDNICSAARNLMYCLDTNCRSNTDREDAIIKVRTRCSVESPFSQYTTEEDTTQTIGPVSEYDLVQNVWYQLTYCDYLGYSGKCDPYKSTLRIALDHHSPEICSAARNLMNCLDNNCRSNLDREVAIGQVRSRCIGARFVNDTSTPTAVTPSVSEPDALSSEWLTLTNCSFKETTETCAREKYTLEFSRALHFEVCRNAYIFLDCLEERCQYSKELTLSIMKIRASCSATSKKFSQSHMVINNYIVGEAESRRDKNILEILGIYRDN